MEGEEGREGRREGCTMSTEAGGGVEGGRRDTAG